MFSFDDEELEKESPKSKMMEEKMEEIKEKGNLDPEAKQRLADAVKEIQSIADSAGMDFNDAVNEGRELEEAEGEMNLDDDKEEKPSDDKKIALLIAQMKAKKGA